MRRRAARRLSGLVAAPAAGAGTPKVLIVGGGPAGDAVAAGLRDAGFDGSITLVGAEPERPYERPHLSKGFLLGTVRRLELRPPDQYEQMQVDLRLGERAVELGVERRRATLESGASIDWDLMCLAPGSDARRLAGFEDAVYLRELPEARALLAWLERRIELDIIGAGFVGCEVAAAAVHRGCRVRVHEALSQPMLRVLGPELGGYIAEMHRQHGVELFLNAASHAGIDGPVLVGVGSEPRAELAEQAGLKVDRGIVVDEWGRTSAPGVFAAGDATRFFSPLYQRRVRVEHFQTAQRQGFAVGRAMAGANQPYDEVPWFWSDQYDLNLQYVGAGLEWDSTVTRGRLGQPPFTVFYLEAGRLVGAAGVNDHHTVARTRRLMQVGAAVSPVQLEDPGFDLRRALP